MKTEYMKPLERVLATFNRQETDRTPVINPTSIATVESMQIADAYFPDVHLDAKKMAALASVGHDHLGFDSVEPYYSVQNEAAAFGAELDWGHMDEMPKQKRPPLKDLEGFEVPDDLLQRLPIKTVLDALSILKEKYGDEVAVMGKIMGPWTLSYNLYGTQDFLMETIIDPDNVNAMLNAFKEIAIRFAVAQVEAGADVITWCDHATGNLVSVDTYREFLLPVQKEAVAEFRRRCPRRVPLILHCCGHAEDRLSSFMEVGFDAFHFDSQNNIANMMKIAGNDILLTGCVNNPQTLLQGSVADVEAQVTEIVKGGVHLVSPECAIPCRVKNENLKAIVDTVKKLTLV